MNYDAAITVQGNISALREAIKTEAKEMARSSITINEKKGKLVLRVSAKDATALRASTNTILKLLIVHEKMAAIK
ncbi:hypothetical protein HY488_01390 [Candidatus Woesearchaeota archaeon]|nr:hypothetical protein [Candidatus Woesearchaeota archaeon]